MRDKCESSRDECGKARSQNFGVRRQAKRDAAFDDLRSSEIAAKAASRFACRRTPKFGSGSAGLRNMQARASAVGRTWRGLLAWEESRMVSSPSKSRSKLQRAIDWSSFATQSR